MTADSSMSRHTLGQEIALQTSVSLSIQRRNRKHLFDAFPRGLRPQQRTATTRDPARDGVQKLPHGTYPFTRRAFESRPFGHQHSIFPTTPRPKAPLHPSGTCFMTSIRSEPPGGGMDAARLIACTHASSTRKATRYRERTASDPKAGTLSNLLEVRHTCWSSTATRGRKAC